MKITNIIILLVIVLAVGYVIHYRNSRGSIAFKLESDTSYVNHEDTLPVSKRYESSRSIKWEKGSLGSSQDVSHQVPTDYRGNSNNWDEDLRHIGR